VKDALLGLEQVRAELKSLGADPAGELKKANLKRYLADSGRVFEMKMNRLPLGMTTVSTQLEGGATVKLILTVSESRIHFDFAGTDASTTIGLTEMTTFGACLAAVTSVLREKIPMNAGSFEHIQVSTPAKTLLSTRAPSGTFRGINAGVAIVAELVQAALAKLNPLLAVAPAIGADSHFLLTFNDGRVLAGHLPSGAGAQKAADGADALALWAPRFAFDITLEESERRFPLVWQQAGVRPSSGGKGQKRGGDGAVRAFRVSEAAKFRWLSAQRGAKATGLEGGQAGLPTLIEVVRVKPTKAGASGETEREEFSASEGEIALQPGDKVTLLTSGGAGYGKVNE
jgi:N-methylhydantoinase B/oxoprolinase/acetone carboxylase alpha subunit